MGDVVAWFFWRDYVLPAELQSAIDALTALVARMREWEAVISRVVVNKAVENGVLREFSFVLEGLTDEWVPERLRVTYKDGKVTVERVVE